MIDAFEEAKDSNQRAVQEARKDIPRYTEAVNNYQEQILESVKEIAENYIDSFISTISMDFTDKKRISDFLVKLGGLS
jgi:vacuolar-type H+-ATPase subunit H